MKKLQIQPPDLRPFDRDRYTKDLAYRFEIDMENQVERCERIKLLLLK